MTIKKAIAVLSLVIAIVFCYSSVTFADQGTLSNFSAAIADNTASTVSHATFRYAIASALAAGDSIFFAQFPAGFTVSGAATNTTVTVDGATVPISVSISGQIVTVVSTNAIAAGAAIVVRIDPITTPSSTTGQNYTIATVSTKNAAGTVLDQHDTVTTFFSGNLAVPTVTFSGGSGTVGDPYQITTCQQLQGIAQGLSAHYKLMGSGNVIDCSGSAAWDPDASQWVDGFVGETLISDANTNVINNGYRGFNPVGDDASARFTGTLDGNGNAITNLWIFRKTTGFNGIFAKIQNATISNLTISNATVTGGSGASRGVGILSGEMNSGTVSAITLTNNNVVAYYSYNGGGLIGVLRGSGSVVNNIQGTGGSVQGGYILGGLIGEMIAGTLSNSRASASVSGAYDVGGLIGHMFGGQTTGSYATGAVSSTGIEGNAGGLVGRISNATVASSYATGNVASVGNNAGGLVGLATTSTISGSYATGAVLTIENGGGLVGKLEISSISTSYARGSVSVVGPNGYGGGLVGLSSCPSNFSTSFASGNVTVSSVYVAENSAYSGGNYAGGFVGYDGCESLVSTFDQTFATGTVTASGSYVGGFAGSLLRSDITNSYAAGNVSGEESVGGFAGFSTYGTIANSYSRGTVTGTTHANGFIGYDDGAASSMDPGIIASMTAITNSFWDNTIALKDASAAYGIAKTTLEITSATTYASTPWNFSSIWAIDTSNQQYPYLLFHSSPTLTEVTAITSQSTVANAVYHFNPSSTDGNFLASECGATVNISGASGTVQFTGLEVGQTYSCSIIFKGNDNMYSNSLAIGPFTVIADVAARDGGGPPGGGGGGSPSGDSSSGGSSGGSGGGGGSSSGSSGGGGGSASSSLSTTSTSMMFSDGADPILALYAASSARGVGGSGSGNSAKAGQSCAPYITSYISLNSKNNKQDVIRLQHLLNVVGGEKLAIDGVYKTQDSDAVKRFQQKNSDVLAFWNLKKPTGYVYIATQKALNRTYCQITRGLTCPYFASTAQQGQSSADVIKVKQFLNVSEKETLALTPAFDASLTAAIKRFQDKYKNDILAPWGMKKATGLWYQATQKKANDIVGCFAPVRLDNGKVLQ